MPAPAGEVPARGFELSFAKIPHEAILVHVTCYMASLYVIDFTCAPNFGEAQGSSHREARRYFVRFRNCVLQRPLNVRKAAAHHSDNRQVTSRPPHGLGASRNMEYRVG